MARATREHPDLQVGASPRAVEHLGDAIVRLYERYAELLPDGPEQARAAATAHSVAANPHNNHVLVPLAANNVFPNCLNGCVAVYGRSSSDDD